MSGLVSGINNNRFGFTFLELLIVLFIMALISSVVAPNFQGKTPRYEREQFIAGLNGFMQTALSQAVSSHALHQVYFDMKTRAISLRKHTGEYDARDEPVCEPYASSYGIFTFAIPEQFTFKQFSIEGINEMRSGSQTKELWFYIMPDGLSQQVTINLLDANDSDDGRPAHVGLVLNPFMVQFKVYDTFQK